jgi:hypothetical protein
VARTRRATPGDVTYVLTSYYIIHAYLRDVGMHINNLQRSVNDMEELVAIHDEAIGVADVAVVAQSVPTAAASSTSARRRWYRLVIQMPVRMSAMPATWNGAMRSPRKSHASTTPNTTA